MKKNNYVNPRDLSIEEQKAACQTSNSGSGSGSNSGSGSGSKPEVYKCPNGGMTLSCSADVPEVPLYGKDNELVGLRCDNITTYCDGTVHIGSGSGSGSGSSSGSNSGSERNTKSTDIYNGGLL